MFAGGDGFGAGGGVGIGVGDGSGAVVAVFGCGRYAVKGRMRGCVADRRGGVGGGVGGCGGV